MAVGYSLFYYILLFILNALHYAGIVGTQVKTSLHVRIYMSWFAYRDLYFNEWHGMLTLDYIGDKHRVVCFS